MGRYNTQKWEKIGTLQAHLEKEMVQLLAQQEKSRRAYEEKVEDLRKQLSTNCTHRETKIRRYHKDINLCELECQHCGKVIRDLGPNGEP